MSEPKDTVAFGDDRGDLGTTGIDEAGLRITGENSLEDSRRPVHDPCAGKGPRCREEQRELLKNRFDVKPSDETKGDEPPR